MYIEYKLDIVESYQVLMAQKSRSPKPKRTKGLKGTTASGDQRRKTQHGKHVRENSALSPVPAKHKLDRLSEEKKGSVVAFSLDRLREEFNHAPTH